jgi:hypothetical protein
MSIGRDLPGAGVVNGVLCVAGGGTGCGEYSSALEIYNPATDTWTSKQPMSKPRIGLGVGVVSGILYAVGGEVAGPDSIQTVEAYDPVTDTWTPKASLPTPRYGFAVGVVGGILYAVGGTDGSSTLATVEAYDPNTDSWSKKAPLPAPTSTLSVGTVNGVLYAIGGSGSSYPYFTGNVWAYDPANDVWTGKASMPTVRAGLAVAEANGILYALGGLNLTSFPDAPFLATNEAFTPGSKTPLDFVGFLAPIGGTDSSGGSFASPLRTFKMGSTIPVKFAVSCNGSAVLIGLHTLQATKYGNATTFGAPVDATPQDAATTGNQFRLTTDGQWQFNLDTRGTGMSVGTWRFIATLSDGSQHIVWIQLK